MKQRLLFLTITFLFYSCNKNDEPRPVVIYEGDIHLLTQQDVDDFGDQGITEVTGRIYIGYNVYPRTSIDNLEALNQLTSVGGDLFIIFNSALKNLNGLGNLSSIGKSLNIDNNRVLMNIEALSNTSSIGGSLAVRSNKVLSNLNGLSSLSSVGKDLFIINNDSLNHLDGISNLSSVERDLIIGFNDKLRNLCGIQLLIRNRIFGSYSVYDNAYNPSEQDIIDGNCMH